ncbi:MAG: hypothetical protein ACO3EE_01840 [Flavobacteriales bacterium]
MSTNIFAGNDTTTTTRSKRQLGFNAGSVSGLGLAYRQTSSINNKLMHQVTFLPFFNEDFYFVDAAYTALYRIRERNKIDFNLYGGSHFVFTSEGTINITGGGIGFDFQMKDFCFNINTGYGLYTINDQSTAANQKNMFMFYPTVEVGLFYKL